MYKRPIFGLNFYLKSRGSRIHGSTGVFHLMYPPPPPPLMYQLGSWVTKAWNGVKPEVIIKSCKKCGIFNALDGTEDDAIFELSDPSDNDDDDEELAGIAE